MTGGAPRRWLEVGGWLLTPVVAWAVAFLGGWVGAILGGRLESSVSGIALILGGAVLGAIVGAFGWARLLRRRDPRAGSDHEPAPEDESRG